MHESYKKWLEEGKPKIFCICGCNTEIKIKNHHKYKGIPKYIMGHQTIGYHHTDECKKINREKHLGKEPVNKGKKGMQIPWNKGLTKETDVRILKYSISLKSSNKAKEQRNILHQLYRGENHPNHIKISGCNNPNYKNGITPLHQIIRCCYKSKKWIQDIFERDNFTCKICNNRGGELNAHHIKSFSTILNENNIKTLDDALKCSEFWDINNGITLCKVCHDKTKL